MFHVDWISDPMPVWSKISRYLTDDSGELERKGQFIGVFDEMGNLAGAFLVKPWNDYCYELHGGVAPQYWGQGRKICYEMGKALFTFTPCLKIVAIVPEFNKMMRACLESLNFKQEGVISKSFLKWTKLHDMILYGLTKKEGRKCRLPQ